MYLFWQRYLASEISFTSLDNRRQVVKSGLKRYTPEKDVADEWMGLPDSGDVLRVMYVTRIKGDKKEKVEDLADRLTGLLLR